MPKPNPKRDRPDATKSLKALFDGDPGRVERFSVEAAGITFDWSKTHLDAVMIDHFSKRLSDRAFDQARSALFAGGTVNISEGRPATHAFERGSGSGEEAPIAAARRIRMRALVDAVEAGAFGDVTAILHIGIGGSVTGPALLVDALGRRRGAFTVAFLSNIDGAAFDEAVAPLDPATTLVVAVSKTFGTAETLANLESALDWLRGAGVADPYGRVIAITADPDAAVEAGVDETRVLTFGQGIGGRYSLWSAVGFSAALALGWAAMEELNDGAAIMDMHFQSALPDRNAPLLAAIADRFYVEQAGCQSRAVFAYDERLRLLLPYLQQLEMESNGKSVTATGDPVDHPTAPVTWGGVGTDAQHAVFQLLHQGTVPVPVEFIAVGAGDDEQDPERHALLLLNAFAQGASLMAGSDGDGNAARAEPGNRPSATILLDALDPRTLGALIAFYEHRTFANAILCGINPFDQYGVELGKQVARRLGDGDFGDLDPSTRKLIEKAGL
ncbi:MAG: glucose-6-phosphate isomerase [Sphingomicrobium sp.]